MSSNVIIELISVFLAIILSMTLHEAMHGYVSYWLGDNTAKLQGRLTLNPIKHIDPVMTIALPLLLALIGAPIFGGAKPVPFNPHNVRGGVWGVAAVAMAGPMTNLVLAFVSFGVLQLASGTLATFLYYFLLVNLGFFAFNIIPIPPLDGSRLLYALAPDFVRQFMEQWERYGMIILLVIVMIGMNQISSVMNVVISGILTAFTAFYRLF